MERATADRHARIYQFRHDMACHIALHIPPSSLTSCDSPSMAAITSWSVAAEWSLWQKARTLHHYVLLLRKFLRQMHISAHAPVSPRQLRELSKSHLAVIPETTSIHLDSRCAAGSAALPFDKLRLAELQHRYIKTKYGCTIGRAQEFLQPLSSHDAVAAQILSKLQKIAAFLDRPQVELPSGGLELLEQRIQGQILPLYERLQTVCT